MWNYWQFYFFFMSKLFILFFKKFLLLFYYSCSQFRCLLFLLLVWLLWLGLPVLYWIRVVKMDIPVFFLILNETLLVFPYSVMLAVDWSYMAFITLRYVPSIFILSENKWVLYLIWSYGFYSSFCICGISC